MLFAAYGSCINKQLMRQICPTACALCVGWLNDYRLTFRSIATIEQAAGARTPVLVWNIDMRALVALDAYVGAPYLYQKQIVQVESEDKIMECIAYVLDGCLPALPNKDYHKTISTGYKDAGIDESYLTHALDIIDHRE